jgi:hypothetical protein
MKAIKLSGLILIFFILNSCERKAADIEFKFVFVKSYCATVTVGGVVGIAEKCFNPGDTVVGKEASDGKVSIRIAAHSDWNDGPAGPNSFQEYLNVPSENLRIINK